MPPIHQYVVFDEQDERRFRNIPATRRSVSVSWYPPFSPSIRPPRSGGKIHSIRCSIPLPPGYRPGRLPLQPPSRGGGAGEPPAAGAAVGGLGTTWRRSRALGAAPGDAAPAYGLVTVPSGRRALSCRRRVSVSGYLAASCSLISTPKPGLPLGHM